MKILIILQKYRCISMKRRPNNSPETVKEIHLYVKIRIYASCSFYFLIKDSLWAPFDGNVCPERSISAGLCNFPNSTAMEIAMFFYAKTPISGNTLIDNWKLTTDTVSLLSRFEN